ncbi:ABC transporter substrate-binding protein [Halorubrum sp. LN27]|uniref:ABC transporter substrate-binding protein n=1 Tax=Halorubrum sp. LN27 TaxID=2801032 RepID=UPI00190A8B93|nr:ABC transporter substrate-binding protein [Halorubrum sp. LN27]
MAEENGYFEDEGVDADLSYFAPGTQDFEGENAFDADWWDDMDEDGGTHGVCEWNAVQEVSETDRDIVGSYSEWDRVVFVDADDDAETIDDLRGRSVGINKYATSFYSMREMLENEGFEEDEIVLEHVGEAEERFDAVKEGKVDSIAVLEPFVTLGRYDEELKEVFDGPCRAAITTREQPEPEKLEGFLAALNRAVADINDDLEGYTDRYVELLEDEAGDKPAFDDVNFERLREEFELREFLPVRAPDEKRIDATTDWMREKGFVPDDADIGTAEELDDEGVLPDDEAESEEDEPEATAD